MGHCVGLTTNGPESNTPKSNPVTQNTLNKIPNIRPRARRNVVDEGDNGGVVALTLHIVEATIQRQKNDFIQSASFSKGRVMAAT
jgi:hypothetical protein